MDFLEKNCEATKLSCRPEQAGELVYTHDVLPDSFVGLGPMGAILSAFRQAPNCAWLVVACDLPLLDEAAIRFLVENRDPSAIATAYRSPESGFPEPLVAIWEPKSYPVLLQFLAQGYSCPRKVLINSPVHLLEAPNPDVLMNVNTPDVVLKKLGVFEG
jgi:molybdopterin-guanine dinucleotide biosynthesis protein A